MLAPAELKYQRGITAAFIAANPTTIVLIPRTRLKDGSGMRLVSGTPRAAQIFRLIDQSSERSPQPGVVQTSDGRERLIDFFLLGAYDTTVQLWDYWTDAQGQLEVAQLFPWNQYEVRAAVVRHA
jgi:hypothetical protein